MKLKWIFPTVSWAFLAWIFASFFDVILHNGALTGTPAYAVWNLFALLF